ncbi:hypothetical protein [Pigmentiphaga sp. CHJ604]|uniref:hypothetical protein n=1 Tax=Pigmentiphaga sp. CHJ604 TaxID=3081984 RepID=UPI0030CE79D0
MTERPILFQAAMVRAILDGRKRQTRRIVKPCKDRDFGCELAPHEIAGEVNAGNYRNSRHGAPGDRLWVRESFSRLESFDFFNPACPDDVPDFWYWADGDPEWGNWTKPKPSIHMPREACRIVLEITGLRVEKLQDISQDDAVAEGCDDIRDMQPRPGRIMYEGGPRAAYQVLWESINGSGSWAANPWVWVVEFWRIEG